GAHVAVEQERALPVADPVAGFARAAGLDDRDRVLEAVEVGETLPESRLAHPQVGRRLLVKPCPECFVFHCDADMISSAARLAGPEVGLRPAGAQNGGIQRTPAK